MSAIKTITACRVCGSKNIVPLFNLGDQPLANSLLTRPDEPEEYFPLSLSFCRDCSLVQLDQTVPPEKLFRHYLWLTGTSLTAQKHAESFYDALITRTERPREGYVLEIASNDGTFLVPFKKNGFTIVGIDPAENIAAMARAQGIPTEAIFFGTKSAEKIVAERGQAKVLFARNVLPHVADTRDFVKALHQCLADDGTLAIESHYAKIIQEDLHYDSIYHEHLCYFTVQSLERLLRDAGLYVFDVTQSPISGGSLVFYAKKHPVDPSSSLLNYREGEARGKTNEFANWQDFAKRSLAHREKLLAMLKNEKKKGRRIAGWGASARSSTLLNFCGITTDTLPVIIDLNPLKQGRYTAGTHIPIKTSDEVMNGSVDCIFLLAWNFENEIIAHLKNDFKFKGTCIIPFPREPRIMELR